MNRTLRNSLLVAPGVFVLCHFLFAAVRRSDLVFDGRSTVGWWMLWGLPGAMTVLAIMAAWLFDYLMTQHVTKTTDRDRPL